MDGGARMEYRLDVGMWNQVFAVPCALVDQHIKLAGKEQLQAILWILRHAGQGFSPEELAGSLDMPLDRALDALDYWCDRGLLSASGGDLRPMPQPEPQGPALQPPEAGKLPEPLQSPGEPSVPPIKMQEGEPAAPNGGNPEPRPLPPRQRLLRPDSGHLTARLEESEGVRFLFQEAEATLGKTLSPAMSALLLTITDDYGLPPEVTVMLLHYAQEAGRTGTSYIDSVARDWAESGIFSIEAAEEKLQELSRRRLAWGKVSAAAGLIKRSPSKSEGEKACRWVYEWEFSQDMLGAAYEACADHTGKFSASYMDKVLSGWHSLGISNLQDLETHRQKAAAEKEKAASSQQSYDIDELERMSVLDIPENL